MECQRRILLIIACCLCFWHSASAQQEEFPKYGSEISLHTGTYLPNQIDGVTEILPFWGARFGYPLRNGALEFGGMNAHAKGVDFTTASVTLRGDLTPIKDFNSIFFLGADVHSYSPLGETRRKTLGGGHVGSGLMFLVSDALWFRTEMKFNINPGVGLYIGFGFVLRARSSDSQY